MLVASLAIYIYSVLDPGDIAAVVADPARRIVELHQANFFATRQTDVPFSDIAGARFVTQYDHDGYAMGRAELLISGNDPISLPIGFGPAEVAALRRALGFSG